MIFGALIAGGIYWVVIALAVGERAGEGRDVEFMRSSSVVNIRNVIIVSAATARWLGSITSLVSLEPERRGDRHQRHGASIRWELRRQFNTLSDILRR